MTADEYQRKFSAGSRTNSRSQSPKKRQRSVPGNEDDDASGIEESELLENQDEEEEEEEERGRTRKRRWSTETSDGLGFFSELKDPTTGALPDGRSSQSPGPHRKMPRFSNVRSLHTPPRSTSPIGQ
ncbi:uncharacterized protein N7483_013176 [Penicillium malachiteum]|uniref:uncharacterized protein n=1 Tax=Penicillium malachiteum TaxID=1324776 RepID=UPI0025495D80|nr:uncharacterized protein N7483_013176 [Penicillium malachiteum]KAJ5715995.1 hypothetical protein N7483_013176 [Penicillium malachiteum]